MLKRKTRIFQTLFLALIPLSLLHAQLPMPALDGSSISKQLTKQIIKAPPPYEQLKRIQSLPEIKKSVTGSAKAIILLVDFPDYTWETQQDSNFNNPINQPGFDGLYQTTYYEEMLFSTNSFKDPFSQSLVTGSMRDYYLENSYNQLDVDGVVLGWYTVSQPYEFYTNNNSGLNGGASSFVREVIELAEADIDYSEFDNDGDNEVDALFVVHAGPGAEELYAKNYEAHFNYFWSHKASVHYQTADSVIVNHYTMEPQSGTIGVFCHEFGHTLGLPDLYDTDQSSEGIGEWGLMASGGWCHLPGDRPGTRPSHFTAYSKMSMGWLQPQIVRSGSNSYRLPPVESEAFAIQVWNDSMSTNLSDPLEYFLLENRQNNLFDAALTRRQVDFNWPLANGLIIYHVNGNRFHNSDDSRRLIDVEEASPVLINGNWFEQLDSPRNLSSYQFLNTGNRGDNGDPFPGYSDLYEDLTEFFGERDKDEFSEYSIPNTRTNDNKVTFISVKNIRIDGEDILLDLDTDETITSVVGGKASTQPESYSFSIFPNPMKGASQFLLRGKFNDPNQNGRITIYNLLGQKVYHDEFTFTHSTGKLIFWDGRDSQGRIMQTGIYFVVAQYGSFQVSEKLIITL